VLVYPHQAKVQEAIGRTCQGGDGLPDVVEVVRFLGDPGRTVFWSSFPAIRPMTLLCCRG
jgi:hypothetical protein